MRAFVAHIGIVDKSDSIHAVSFGPGVNVVTGKSSTGKSALIEIFDFCFGSSDFTVPDGIITANADIYFVVIQIKGINIVLGRKQDSTTAFIREDADESATVQANRFNKAYLQSEYFLPIADLKKEVGRYFGLQITDVDENAEDRRFRGNKKSPTPSIRSFTSFILQHQNLVANKHAIFYRFDEKEKREQTIEHFKIFIGLVNQAYFMKTQELHTLQVEQRNIEIQIPRLAESRKKAEESLRGALYEYEMSSGSRIDIGEIADALQNPMRVLEIVRQHKVTVASLSEKHAEQKEIFDREKAMIVGDIRKSQQKISSIKTSILYAKSYIQNSNDVSTLTETEIHASECPFCRTHHSTVELEANKLNEAIGWLNFELERSPYLLDSFEEQEKRANEELSRHKQRLSDVESKLLVIETQIVDLEKYKSQHELALKAKIKIEILLEQFIGLKNAKLDDRLVSLKKKISDLKDFLKKEYDVETKLKLAEASIDEIMSGLGSQFDFEESYKPIHLKFSLETFDLWHEASNRKVFLRSMGSGANWLYCHLTLFLALQSYFCRLGDTCCIPSILFFDQPSQVYFPSVLDNGPTFDAKKIADAEGETRLRPVDEDIKAVENFYSQLVKFSKATLASTGIEPQIIVTDHADNLQLSDGIEFESLVNGRRWRTHGFVNLKSAPLGNLLAP